MRPAPATSAALSPSVVSFPSRTPRSSGAPQLGADETDRGCNAARHDRRRQEYARAIGFRYHDGKPGIVEGLLSRGDRRVGKVVAPSGRDGGRFDGWSEYFSYDRWMAAAAKGLADEPSTSPGTPPVTATSSRCSPGTTSTPASTANGSGRTGRRRSARREIDDCRWTPCFDCGVCPQMGTEIQIGPTGRKLLPLARSEPELNAPKRQPDITGRPTEVAVRIRLRFAKRGRLRFTSHRDVARAFERAIRRAGIPMAYSSGFSAHPRVSWAGAARRGPRARPNMSN